MRTNNCVNKIDITDVTSDTLSINTNHAPATSKVTKYDK